MNPMRKVIAQQAMLLPKKDHLWNQVRFLVKLNGEHGDPLNLVDLSGYHPTFHYSPNPPVYSNAQSRFGGSSGHFDTVSNVRWAATPMHADLINHGTGDWTVEFWCFVTHSTNTPVMAIGTYDSNTICLWLADSTANYFGICWLSTSLNRWVVPPQVPPNGTSLFTLNAWHHVAFSKSGTTVYVFIDGQLVCTFTDNGSFPAQSGERIVLGGVDSAFGFYGRCFVEQARITLAARYTAPFTPRAFLAGP